MRRSWLWFPVVVALGGCAGQAPAGASSGSEEQESTDGVTGCTDPAGCCAPEKIHCSGDPDLGVICVCTEAWDCSENLDTCQAALPTPDGGGDWQCAWNDVAFVCKRPGAEQSPPEGDGRWFCRWVSEEAAWECTTSPWTPSGPAGTGDWRCTIDLELRVIVCEQTGISDGEGTVPMETPPPPPPLEVAEVCIVGQRMWCEGSDFCGWGLVDCDPATGTWQTKEVDGQPVVDCRNTAQGRRPDTLCACYHYSFTAQCCERPDCLVEPDDAGQYGQICPANEGKLCDYCDPVVESSCGEPGGMCLMVKTKESFCVGDCASQPCPLGYKCTNVTTPSGTSRQCVPEDMSCFR